MTVQELNNKLTSICNEGNSQLDIKIEYGNYDDVIVVSTEKVVIITKGNCNG
jgi:hypothetical protein